MFEINENKKNKKKKKKKKKENNVLFASTESKTTGEV